jgi:hypothetical protein
VRRNFLVRNSEVLNQIVDEVCAECLDRLLGKETEGKAKIIKLIRT